MIFSPLLSLTVLLSGLAATTSAAAYHRPTVYIIRHAEKPVDPNGHGLTKDGFRRAECLRSIFGAESHYDIGLIVAPTVWDNGKHQRSWETVLPLARDLGLTVNTACEGDNIKCVKKLVKHYKGPGNILISWRHSKMQKIVRKLGNLSPPEYPGERYDIIWTDPWPYTNITDIWDENCPGLDVPDALRIQE